MRKFFNEIPLMFKEHINSRNMKNMLKLKCLNVLPKCLAIVLKILYP